MPYEKARAFVHKLNLKNNSDWLEYCDSGNLPNNIPKTPISAYKDKGWNGLGDWLGTNTVQTQKREYLSFTDARKFVRLLHLKQYRDWPKYCVSGQKPGNIPSAPDHIYRDQGWIGMADWLGLPYHKKNEIDFLPFEQARANVHKQRIKTITAWYDWCKSGKKPENIPSRPNNYYKDKGWWGWRDWLGPR
jgi:hypothetical protein